MFNIIKRRSTHASKLERWLGPNKCAEFSALHKDWYGPPIALADVPGEVYCRGGGDFVGNIDAGGFQNYWDHMIKRAQDALHQAFLYNQTQMATGFATLSALQEAARNGYARTIWLPAPIGGTNNAGYDNWGTGGFGGSFGAAAPGGTVYNSTSARANFFPTCQSGKTLTLVNAEYTANFTAPISYLICDRLFAVAKTMNTTASEAVTGVPTRYQSTTSTDADWCGGNFVYPRVTTNLPATAHNHNVCQYTDQDGNTGVSFPSQAGRAPSNASSTDLPFWQWFMNLESGDVGVKAITQLQLDAAVATGAINYVLAHPLYWVTHVGATDGGSNRSTVSWGSNGINSAMQTVRVFDDSCLYPYQPRTANANASNISLTGVEG